MTTPGSYGRLGNDESIFLEDVIALSLDLQALAVACASLSDDPVALEYAKRSRLRAKEIQQRALQYRERRSEAMKNKKARKNAGLEGNG